MCFVPQRRSVFKHLNFQKWSELGVFCTFWLRYVLRATTACSFETSQLPKVVRTWCVLYILTSKCDSRHNSVHFFNIATSKSVPNLVCFVHFDFEMCFAPQRRATFRPSGATNHRENTVFRDFPTFSRISIFFLLTLSLLWSSLFCSSLFCSSLLSDSSHLCFSSVHTVGSLTCKLPSNIAIEARPFRVDFAMNMVIIHSYVSLEGKFKLFPWPPNRFSQFPMRMAWPAQPGWLAIPSA